MKRLLLILAAAALLAGCTVGPNYHPPKIETPPAFAEANAAGGETNAPAAAAVTATNQAEVLGRWWTLFKDPELESLEGRALKNNRDLRMAYARVLEARAQRGVVAAGLLPEVGATGGFNDARGSKNVDVPLSAFGGGASPSSHAAAQKRGRTVSPHEMLEQSTGSAQLPSAVPPDGPQSPFGLGGLPGAETDLYQMGLQTSWDIDVFGGTRRSIEAAWANIAASEEGRRAVLVGLMAEVATNYMQMRSAQARLQIAHDALQSQQQTLAIIQARVTNGLSTELDYQQQLAEEALTRASIPPLRTLERECMHALAFLVAADPASLEGELSPPEALPAEPPMPPLGLPSDLLRRRPDVRQAERELAAATAQVGAATADLFPKFSLTAAAGMDASRAENLLDWSSRYFAFSPGVSWPILDWGRIRSNIKVQNALQAEALTQYEDTVARAVRQVEDTLVQYGEERAHREDLKDAAQAGSKALALARARFEKGLSDFLTVLTAQRSLLAAQDALAQSDAAIRSDLVRLYAALGGGWEP